MILKQNGSTKIKMTFDTKKIRQRQYLLLGVGVVSACVALWSLSHGDDTSAILNAGASAIGFYFFYRVNKLLSGHKTWRSYK